MSRLTLFPVLVVVPVWLNWYIPLSSVGDSTRVGTVKIVKNEAKTAQLAKNPTQNPGAMLMGVRVPSAVRDFSSRVSLQCRLLQCPYSPRVQSPVSCLCAQAI